MNRDEFKYKIYMADTGLLISQAFSERVELDELYRKLITGKLEVNRGMIVENLIAQILKASGKELYFYSKSSREAEDRMEIDFLIRKSTVTSRHNICPIEVKSSKGHKLTSLNKCIKKFSNQISTPYVLHDGDVKIENGIVFFFFFMAPCL